MNELERRYFKDELREFMRLLPPDERVAGNFFYATEWKRKKYPWVDGEILRSLLKEVLEELELESQAAAAMLSETHNYAGTKSGRIKRKFEPRLVSELLETEFPDSSWVVYDLIPAPGITAISASPANFKTWLCLEIGLRVAKGEILFDKFATTPSPVLLIDEESGPRTLKARFEKLQKDYSNLPFFYISRAGFKINSRDIAEIISFCKENGVKVVIMDSLKRIHEADENDASAMSRIFAELTSFLKEEISVIFVHHNRKTGFISSGVGEMMRGSSDILAVVDCHLAVKKEKDGFLTIIQNKLRQAQELPPFRLGIVQDETEMKFLYIGEIDDEKSKKEKMWEALQELLTREERPIYKTEAFILLKKEGIEGSSRTFSELVKEEVTKGRLFLVPGERNKKFLSLRPQEVEGPIGEE